MDKDLASSSGTGEPARWSLRLFGGFELGRPAGEKVALPGKRERVLLVYLALSPNCRQPRRKLAALLWGDATDETLLDNLRATLWKLRKALDDTEHRVLASDGEDIVLDAQAFEVDTWAFQRLATNADRVGLEAAAKLYAGKFLDGLDIDSEEFEAWRRTEATRFRDQATDVLTRLMAQLAEAGETERAIEVGTRILKLDPLNDAAVRRLMRLYAESGRRGTAVQLYRTLAEALKTELDAQPEAETRALFAEIGRGGEEIPAPTAAEAKPLPSASIASPSVGPPSLPPAMPEPAQEGPAIGAAQNVLPSQPSKRPLGWIVAGGLAAAIALFLLYQFAGPIAQPTGIEAAKTASSSTAGTVAIAVLPFVNLSSDPEQEFFSDGITEEVTAALAKVQDLRVVARTSAFQFRAQNRDIQSIGQQLHATHFIEGSVRKEGNRVRITAQLIAADSGVHMWAENYDRELTDVFAIQEEIATAIAGALRVPLGLKQGERLVSNRIADTDSYQNYLQARTLMRVRGAPSRIEAAKLLEQVVARDPNYAPAWGMLGQAYASIAFPQGPEPPDRSTVAQSLQKAEAAAQQAIRLDPNHADGYAALAIARDYRGQFAQAEDLYKQALFLDPGIPEVLYQYGLMNGLVGRLKDALAMILRLEAQEPLVQIYDAAANNLLALNGRNDEAIAMYKRNLPGRAPFLAQLYASMGRYGEAADALREIPSGNFPPGAVDEAIRVLSKAPAQTASPQAILNSTRLVPILNGVRAAPLAFAYLYTSTPGRALEPNEITAETGLLGAPGSGFLWGPSYAPVRKTERFKAFVRKIGLVDYWKTRGWPEFCHPTTGDDFTCA